MANTKKVFSQLEPYDPNKPMFRLNIPSKEELIAATLGLIPGYRALKNMNDNPEGPISETLDLAAEDLVPLYGSLIKPVFQGEDIDAEQVGKELAMAAVPVRLSSRARQNRTHNKIDPVEVPAGPYQTTNNGSNVANRGARLNNTNTIPVPQYDKPYNIINGRTFWQGDMYPPGRSLRKDDMYGPFQWENDYSRKLNDVIDENEVRWEYLLNKTRRGRSKGVPGFGGRINSNPLDKEYAAYIATEQGRPDWAERILKEDINTPYINPNRDHKFMSYQAEQRPKGGEPNIEKWKDISNRQVEKELRETFATLPEDSDIRFRFSDYYGTPDLYQSWINEPNVWNKYKEDVIKKRKARTNNLKIYDKKYRGIKE